MAQSHNQRKYLRLFLLVLGFTTFVVLTFAVSWKYFESRTEEDASRTRIESFPVVIITSDKAEIITLDLLKDYQTQNPNYSFLVPIGEIELINQQLEDFQKARRRSGFPEIKVEEISEGKQLIELKISDDGFLVSKYEASEKEIKPLSSKLADPGFIFLPCGTTLFIGIIGVFFLRFILRFMKRGNNLK